MQEFLMKNLGYIAGFFTTIAFLPQVIKVWRTKSTKDISIWMFLIFTTGVLSLVNLRSYDNQLFTYHSKHNYINLIYINFNSKNFI